MTNPAPVIQPSIKLKPRLRRLFGLIQAYAGHYDSVWDCCCDHGYLGMKLLRKKVCSQVQFVDRVPHLMDDLRQRLGVFAPNSYTVLCDDAGNIDLDTKKRHLIVLAGIGGELAATIIDNIVKRHPQQKLSFLLCPNTAQYFLRDYLIRENFQLIEEDFLREKRWNYEIILVATQPVLASSTPAADCTSQPASLSAISPIGALWRADDDHHLAYLEKMQQHYSNQGKNCESGEAFIIAALYGNRLQSLKATRPLN